MPVTLNARELRRMANGPAIATATRVTAALEELAELAWIRFTPARDGGAGRNRRDCAVNPMLHAAAGSTAP